MTLEGEAVVGINNLKNEIYLSNGRKLEYKYFVGADGANSLFRKSLGYKLKRAGFCIETNVSLAYVKHLGNMISFYNFSYSSIVLLPLRYSIDRFKKK